MLKGLDRKINQASLTRDSVGEDPWCPPLVTRNITSNVRQIGAHLCCPITSPEGVVSDTPEEQDLNNFKVSKKSSVPTFQPPPELCSCPDPSTSCAICQPHPELHHLVEQMVQEVDDLELSRCKVLDQQQDELKSHLDAAKNAIHFRNRIMELTGSGEETHFSLFRVLESRTEALITTHIKEKPQHHPNLQFKAASDGDLAIKTKEAIGKVIPCQASARHSKIEGSATRKAQKGKPVDIIIRAENSNSDCLTTGGDAVSTRWVSTLSAENTPRTSSITDHGNGSYTMSCVCPSASTFQLEVYMNGEKMATDVTITCVAFSSAFDPAESHPSVTISEERKMAALAKRLEKWAQGRSTSPS